ncbi:hypothetical protein C8J57DRAFT_1520244 [Mycena rebaudengoi]|nr:hypothetical protein C8J57DRAFT_1520244 [Mycena rebaudengoi]
MSATFCNLPLSTSVDASCAKSLLSLEWVLSSGVSAAQSSASGVLSLPYGDSVCCMQINVSICSSLPYDHVLGVIGYSSAVTLFQTRCLLSPLAYVLVGGFFSSDTFR